MKTFQRPKGHEKHFASSTIAESLSFGWGELDEHGFWEYGCPECARAHEEQFPEDGECWPFTPESIKKMKQYRKEHERKPQ